MAVQTNAMTRGRYEAIRDKWRRRRQEILRELPTADVRRQEVLHQELVRALELPALPVAYVYMLYELDGTYMGTVRTREEVRELRRSGLELIAERAKDLHPRHRPVDPAYAELVEGAR
jgi:hypothetical protein